MERVELGGRRPQRVGARRATGAATSALRGRRGDSDPIQQRALRRAARVGAVLYLTVELPESQESIRAAYERAAARGWPVVRGEVSEDDGYDYYPERPDVRRWLRDAALEVFEQADGDEYWHLWCRRVTLVGQ
jgi:hypothetical protein